MKCVYYYKEIKFLYYYFKIFIEFYNGKTTSSIITPVFSVT